jgi:hypothetical protein
MVFAYTRTLQDLSLSIQAPLYTNQIAQEMPQTPFIHLF